MFPINGEQNASLDPTLDWKNAVGADSYDVQISDNGSFSSPVLDTTGVLSDNLNVTGLSGSTTHYWRVRSVNSSGTSNWTSAWSFRTQDPVPESPVPTSPSDKATDQSLSTTVQWNSVTYATNYRVELSNDSLFFNYVVR